MKIFDAKKSKELNPFNPIENEEIESMFLNLKKDVKKTTKDENNEEYIPFNVQKVLQMQENTLNQIGIREENFEKMYKHLAKKSNKKEEDLLIKKIDHLRIKKELDDIIINKNNSSGNYPISGQWIMNLRAEKNNLFPASSYLNYGEKLNPYFIPIRERRYKSTDIFRDPNSSSTIDSKLLNGNIDLLSENKSYLNEKSSINSSIINYMQSLNTNLNNQSISLDDFTSINTIFSPKNGKKSLSDLVVKLK